MAETGSVAEEIGRHIQRKGYSLERLAKESGVSKATIHRWMTGKVVKPYYWENVLNVANALNLTRIETNRFLRSMQLPSIDTLWNSATPEQQPLFERWVTHSRNNLPGTLTSFVGRETEILDIAALLGQDDVRLVTLTGPGGAGKTRLSTRVAGELHDVFPDGIFFVSLAAVTDHALIVPAIARALEVRDAPGQSTSVRLSGYLRDRRMLLVLDNVEHLVDAAPGVVSLLEHARFLTVLATSRIPLRVSCEHVRPVAQFDVPGPETSIDALANNHAVRLFAERATAVNPAFRLDEGNASAVAGICVRLEGSPLAIELAAARCRQFMVEDILERFPIRLDLGADGPHDLPDRQRSLRAAIDWSYGLLSPDGQALFRKLAVFSDGWDMQAVLQVCDAGEKELNDLVDASLLYRLDGGRYGMLETIREYGLEQLQSSGEEVSIRDAHAQHYRYLSGNRSPYIPLNQQLEWLTQVDLQHDNIRSALQWSMGRDDNERVVGIAGGLWPYWHEYGHFREGLQWLELALATEGDRSPSTVGSVLTGAFLLSYSVSELARARMYGNRALDVWKSIGDWHGVALVLSYLGLIEYSSGGDEASFARSAGMFQSSVDAWQLAGQPLGVAHSTIEMAVLCQLTGQFRQAEDLLSTAREIFEQHQNQGGLARVTIDQGLLKMLQFDLPGAIETLEIAVNLSTTYGSHVLLPWAQFYLGTSYCFAGDLDRATQHLNRSLRTHHEDGTRYGMAFTLLGFAALRHRQGRHQEAAMLCGAVTALLETTGLAMNPAVHQIYLGESASVKSAMGNRAFDAAFARGRDMTGDETVALALGAADAPAS